MKYLNTFFLLLMAIVFSSTLYADDLTMMVEKNLAALGYATGPVDGDETMETVIAISKFQAENQLDVTGEVTPQLAGVLSARVANPEQAPATATAAPVAEDPAALQTAQQACLQMKMEEAQEAKKKKRGFGRLVSAVARTAGRMGNHDVSGTVGDVYGANATADDLAAAAKDLGLTEDDVTACQNPN